MHDLPPSDHYKVKYEDDDWLVLKFKTHNERDKFLSNDSGIESLRTITNSSNTWESFFKSTVLDFGTMQFDLGPCTFPYD